MTDTPKPYGVVMDGEVHLFEDQTDAVLFYNICKEVAEPGDAVLFMRVNDMRGTPFVNRAGTMSPEPIE